MCHTLNVYLQSTPPITVADFLAPLRYSIMPPPQSHAITLPFGISQVEEQKKRAEADKLAALTALEKRSREFLREKEEKRQLEAKIQVGLDIASLWGMI